MIGPKRNSESWRIIEAIAERRKLFNTTEQLFDSVKAWIRATWPDKKQQKKKLDLFYTMSGILRDTGICEPGKPPKLPLADPIDLPLAIWKIYSAASAKHRKIKKDNPPTPRKKRQFKKQQLLPAVRVFESFVPSSAAEKNMLASMQDMSRERKEMESLLDIALQEVQDKDECLRQKDLIIRQKDEEIQRLMQESDMVRKLKQMFSTGEDELKKRPPWFHSNLRRPMDEHLPISNVCTVVRDIQKAMDDGCVPPEDCSPLNELHEVCLKTENRKGNISRATVFNILKANNSNLKDYFRRGYACREERGDWSRPLEPFYTR